LAILRSPSSGAARADEEGRWQRAGAGAAAGSADLEEEIVVERRTPEPLWTPIDVAAYLSVPVQTLYQWRRKRTGPPCRRVGRHLRYEPNAVRSWFAELSDDGAA
jgi:Helix-turn-helix domain